MCRPLIVMMVHDPSAETPRCRLQEEDSEEYGPPIVPETAVAAAIKTMTEKHLAQTGGRHMSNRMHPAWTQHCSRCTPCHDVTAQHVCTMPGMQCGVSMLTPEVCVCRHCVCKAHCAASRVCLLPQSDNHRHARLHSEGKPHSIELAPAVLCLSAHQYILFASLQHAWLLQNTQMTR